MFKKYTGNGDSDFVDIITGSDFLDVITGLNLGLIGLTLGGS